MALMKMETISSDKMQPTQNFILVKPSKSFEKKEEEVTESGLVLALEKKTVGVNDRPTYGIVLSCGPKCETIIPGMEVFWDLSRGQDMMLKDGEFIMLMEDTVIAYRKADEVSDKVSDEK